MELNKIDDLLKLAGVVREIDPSAEHEAEAEVEAPEADYDMEMPMEAKKVCKDCGCEMHNCDPDCECPHDSHDEEGDHWVEEMAEWANSGDHVDGEPRVEDLPKGEPVDTSLRRHVGADAMPVKVEEMVSAYREFKDELMNEDYSEELIEEVNEDEVRELVLYAENDGTLYSQSTAPIQKNLSKKWTKGIYDHDKAITLWKYHADRAAKAYGKEFGNDDGFKMFSPAVRKEAAKEFADSWLAELEAGNLHEEADAVAEASGEFAMPFHDMADEFTGGEELHGAWKQIVDEMVAYFSADDLNEFVAHFRSYYDMDVVEAVEEVEEVTAESEDDGQFDDVDQDTIDAEFADEELPFQDVDDETLDSEELDYLKKLAGL